MVALEWLDAVVVALDAAVVAGTETVILSVQLTVVVVYHEGVGGDWSEDEEEVSEVRVMVTVSFADPAEATPARATVSK